MTNITLEQVEQFIEMLTGGDLPDGMTLANQPELTSRQAFSVVYYLQEILRLIPDHYEVCAWCHQLYDSYRGGHSIDIDDAEHDSWYKDCGIPLEAIARHDGSNVCSSECEYNYLMKSQNGDDGENGRYFGVSDENKKRLYTYTR